MITGAETVSKSIDYKQKGSMGMPQDRDYDNTIWLCTTEPRRRGVKILSQRIRGVEIGQYTKEKRNEIG